MHVTTSDMSLDWLLRPQLEAFAAAGYRIVGVSASGDHVDALRASGIEHVAVDSLTRSMRPHRDLAALAELFTLFRRLRPDVVHTHNPKPGVLGRIAARAAGVPVVVNTVHGLYAQPDDPLRRRVAVYGAERVAAVCSDLELVQNPEDVAALRRLAIPEHRVELLGNGVDLGRFRPVDTAGRAEARAALGLPARGFVCGVVGRLVAEKGYREVLAAAVRLAASDPSITFAIVGPTEPDKADAVPGEMIDRAKDAGVVFLGRRDDMERIYPLFDAYLLASYREGFPRSAMEAAACGLPLIVTDIRGGRQVVDDGVTGRLVPVRDTDAIVDAVRELAADEDRRARWGGASAQKARREFDQRVQIDRTLAAYDRLLRGSTR